MRFRYIASAVLLVWLAAVSATEAIPTSQGKKRPPGYVPVSPPVRVVVVEEPPRFVDQDPAWELVRSVETPRMQAAYSFRAGDAYPDLEVVLFRTADLDPSDSRQERLGTATRFDSKACAERGSSRLEKNSNPSGNDTIVRVEGQLFQDGSFSRKAFVFLPMYGYQDRLRRALLQGLAIWAIRGFTDERICSMLSDFESCCGQVGSRGSVRNTLSYFLATNPRAVEVAGTRPILKQMLGAVRALKELGNEETFAQEQPPYTFAWPMAREQAIRFLSGIEDLPEYDKIPSFGEMSKVNPASPVKDRFVTWGLDTDNDRYWVSESRRRRNWPTLLRDPFQRHGEAP